MIKFFRRIRFELMEKNKTGKPALPAGRYLKYAIGEIVLVVIGILIALQINNWNENRKFKSLKKVYIERLIDDIKQDTTQISILIEETMKKQKIIEKVINGLDIGINNESLKSYIIDYLNSGWNMNDFTPSSNTYSDLSQTGNMNVFRNTYLTDRIKQYYILIEDGDKSQNINKDWIIPIDVTVAKETTAFEFDPITMHLFNPDDQNIALQNIIEEKDLFKRNAAGHYWFNSSLIKIVNNIKTHAIELINTLQDELKKNK